jgi:hypothetical protein
MRKLIVSVLILVALLAVADRVAVSAAQRDVARRIQVDQHLRSTPSVTIGGFPFLTQLVAGTYDDVTVTVRGLHSGALAVSRLTAHAHGVHVSFGDVLAQHISRVPIDRATAQVVLSYADLNAYLAGQHLRVGPGSGGAVRLTGTVAGVAVSADAQLSVRGDAVVLSPGSGVAGVEIPLPGLPFQTHLNSVKATQAGIVVSGSATGLVLRA